MSTPFILLGLVMAGIGMVRVIATRRKPGNGDWLAVLVAGLVLLNAGLLI
ncbi:MAG: hypothetical protein PHV74_04005 [Dehalococcoidia bacterium]|nr:hypothetical protein [Dehalococcoidia bacterium]